MNVSTIFTPVEVVVNYAPFAKQRDFHEDISKFKAFIGGVGSGKTKAGVAEVIKTMVENPGVPGMIVAPTYRLLSDVTQRAFFEMCPLDLIKEHVRSEKRLVFHNGSEVWFRSADEPEMLRGPNLGWAYLDEASLYSSVVWKIMLGRLRLSPGRMWITTTPKGYNWVYKEFAEKVRDNYSMIHCSSRENPYLPSDFVSSLEESYSGVFAKQEVEGLFVAAEGLVYQSFNRFEHVKIVEKGWKDVIAGLDWGWQNPSVMLVIGIDGDDNYHVLEEYYARKVMLDDFVKIVSDAQKKYEISTFYADPSEPQNIQLMKNAGLNVLGADNELLPGINKVGTKLSKKPTGEYSLTVSPSCVNLIMEFENYRYPENKEGHAERDVPIKAFDHAMDALRYAIYSREKGTGRVSILSGDGFI